MLSSIVFPLIAVGALWPLGLDGLWLNQTATFIPLCGVARLMLRKTMRQIDKK